MRKKENLGPSLLGYKEYGTVNLCGVFAVSLFSVLWWLSGFARFPFYLEIAVFHFAAFRFGHVMYRVFLLIVEKGVLRQLYKESKFRCWKYALGDLEAEFLLCVLTTGYYHTHCNGSGFFPALLVCAGLSFFRHLAKWPGQTVIRRAISKRHDLNIGYGLAYFYYHNYLVYLLKDNKFRERLGQYACEEEVPLSSCKLFILVPENCVVEKYIDQNPNESLRTKETKPLKLDVAGIKGRVYVNTVYEIFSEGPDNPEGILRCVIECAQPLKQLRELFTVSSISQEEMLYERQSFIFNLEKFLHDDYDSFRTIVLVSVSGPRDIVRNVKSAAKKCQESTIV